MGHNVTDRKLQEREAKTRDGLPAGWARQAGSVRGIATPIGLLARGGLFAGRCRAHPECTRRVQVDLTFWVDHGFGDVSLVLIADLYACGRWGGCKLELAESWPGGAPLFSVLQEDAGIGLQITCRGCGWNRSWLVSTIIAKLQETGRGGANTGCHAFSASLRCPGCRDSEWATTLRRH